MSAAPAENYLLFCSTGLGDSLFATPAIRHLRQQRPDSRIVLVCKNKLNGLFTANQHLTELISYRNKFWSRWLAKRKIRQHGPYRAVFMFHVGSDVINLVADIPYRTLHCCQQLPGLPENAQLFPIDIENRRQWEDFAAMVTREVGGENANNEFELPATDSERNAARSWYEEKAGARPWIGFQLGGSHLGKCWPPDRYAEIANRCLEQWSGTIFVNVTAAENDLFQQFQDQLLPAHRSQVHRLPCATIGGLAAQLGCLDLFVTNDTGPLHVALSQKIPVVALKAHDDATFPYTIPRPTEQRRPIFEYSDVPTSGRDYQRSHRAMECIECDQVMVEIRHVMEQCAPVGD